MEIALVYMAAGISSRFGGKIKQFSKVGPNQETLIEYSLKQALPAGFTKIIFIVGNKTEHSFKEKFGNIFHGIQVEYALQAYDENLRDRPWGTTDAICSLKDLDCPFVVCNGDDLYGEKTFKILFKHLQNSAEEATIGYKLIDAIPETGEIKRGILRAEKGYVQSINETFHISKSSLPLLNLKPSDLCSMSIFAFHPDIIKMLKEKADNFKQLHKGDREIECLLPDSISELIKEGKIKMKIYSAAEKWLGITNPEDENIVRNSLAGIK